MSIKQHGSASNPDRADQKPSQPRILAQLVREICAEQGIPLTSFSRDWILMLEKNSRHVYIMGNNFGLNSAASHKIAIDKAATSAILQHHGIPCVPHEPFHCLLRAGPAYVPASGNWPRMVEYLHEYGEIVLKPNDGSKGKGVFRAATLPALESAVQQLFEHSRTICLSPYFDIAHEYRTIVLKGRCELIFDKRRTVLRGDGTSTVKDLLITHLKRVDSLDKEISVLADGVLRTIDLDKVLPDGEIFDLNWHHNLSHGAEPEVISEEDKRYHTIAELAVKTTWALDIVLASVDVIEVNGSYRVLEVNTGIMMESFAKKATNGRALTKCVFEKIIDSL